MKQFFQVIIFLGFLYSCNYNNSKKESKAEVTEFEKSFKEQKDSSFVEYLDTIKNVYSNYQYDVAFDAPDNWLVDSGISEHNIFRAYQPDSAITFTLNVIESREDANRKRDMDLWKLYQEQPDKMNSFMKLIEEQLNTKIENLTAKKTFLRSQPALRRSFEYRVREFDLEYNVIFDNVSNNRPTTRKKFLLHIHPNDANSFI